MVELIDETERAASQRCALLVRQPAAVASLDQYRTVVRPLQQPGDMQQRRFPGARRPDQRDDFAGKQREVHPVQHRKRDTALPEHFSHAAQLKDCDTALQVFKNTIFAAGDTGGPSVMAGLDPAIHNFAAGLRAASVGARDQPGHDVEGRCPTRGSFVSQPLDRIEPGGPP